MREKKQEDERRKWVEPIWNSTTETHTSKPQKETHNVPLKKKTKADLSAKKTCRDLRQTDRSPEHAWLRHLHWHRRGELREKWTGNIAKSHMLRIDAVFGWRTLAVTSFSPLCASCVTFNVQEETGSSPCLSWRLKHTPTQRGRPQRSCRLQSEVHVSIGRCVTWLHGNKNEWRYHFVHGKRHGKIFQVTLYHIILAIYHFKPQIKWVQPMSRLRSRVIGSLRTHWNHVTHLCCTSTFEINQSAVRSPSVLDSMTAWVASRSMAAAIRGVSSTSRLQKVRVWLKVVFEKSMESAAPEVHWGTAHRWMWTMAHMMLNPSIMPWCGHGLLTGSSV